MTIALTVVLTASSAIFFASEEAVNQFPADRNGVCSKIDSRCIRADRDASIMHGRTVREVFTS